MKESVIHCPRIDHRPVLLAGCKWRFEGGWGQEPAPECLDCREWDKVKQREVIENLKPVEWPWEAGKEG